MTIQIKKHQTLVDLAIQYCGTVEALAELAALNVLQTTDELTPGAFLLVPAAYDDKVAKYFSDNNLQPVTLVDAALGNEEGIEFWAIEYDFIVGPQPGDRGYYNIVSLDNVAQGTNYKYLMAAEYALLRQYISAFKGTYFTAYGDGSPIINNLDDIIQGTAHKFLIAWEYIVVKEIITSFEGEYTVEYVPGATIISSLDDIEQGSASKYLSAWEYTIIQQIIAIWPAP